MKGKEAGAGNKKTGVKAPSNSSSINGNTKNEGSKMDTMEAETKQIVPIRSGRNAELDVLASAARQITKMRDSKILRQSYCDINKIIYPAMADRNIANSFREIRTKILTLSQGHNFITMVSSVGSQGGASFVSLNIATAFSFEESKTALLVDCNLRNPKQHELLSLENKVGLTDYLEDTSIDMKNIIYPSGIKRLRIIPVGKKRENVVEYFTSIRMKRFLDAIQMRYNDRYIFIDAPSVGESVDARIIAELCDFVVLVVDYAKVTEAKLMKSVEAVGEERLAGVILNRDPIVISE